MFKKSSVLFLLLLLLQCAVAQKTTIYTHEDADFKTAVQLYENQKYGAAQKYFNRTIESHKEYSPVRIDAEFYAAICAIELFNKDCELLLKQFILKHPESVHIRKAYFNLGKYNYRKKKYKDAIEYFWAVDANELTPDEKSELFFKRGYSYFELNQQNEEEDKEKLDPLLLNNEQTPRRYVASAIENAKTDFYQIKDIDNKYAHAANYYYSHIAYAQQNYETALQGFLRLTADENFGPIVPYYITQIYYVQGKYDDAVKYATPLLSDTGNTKRLPEIARIIGESFYKKKQYKEAIPFLKQYEKSITTLQRDDLYQLGYAYYKINNCDSAIIYMQQVVNEQDSLSQNAYYHLGDCYIKKANKQAARNAFGEASKTNFDKTIKEDALYSYAKLCYELAFNPYSDAIKAFNQYIKEYPNSERIDEAYGFLVNVYLTSKNYKEALRSIESIKKVKEEMKPVFQKVAYYLAVDYFNSMQLDSALKYFNVSTNYPISKELNALSSYWKGESYYRKKEYQSAIENYSAFMIAPSAFNMQEYNNANYNIGYCYFHLKNYDEANIAFRKFVIGKNNSDKNTIKRLNDGYNRIGDSYFIKNQYQSAIENYTSAIKIKQLDIDYALYQRALANGLLKNNTEKINDLVQVITEYPKSNYAAATKFELGKAYFQNNSYDKALSYFNMVVSEYPNSSFVNKSLSQIGLIHYNKKEDDLALKAFDKLIKRDRKSEEAEEALSVVKKIYVAKNDIDGLEVYFKEVSAYIPTAALDSASYNIAKTAYLETEYKQALSGFTKYVQRFPDGLFVLDAYYYKAECELKENKPDAALASFNYIISKPKNGYTENALVAASNINYKNKNYTTALSNNKQLEEIAEYPKNIIDARIGMMRCNYLLNNYDAAIANANQLITSDKIQPDIVNEIHVTIAKSALTLNNIDLAYAEFQTAANTVKGEWRAEAKYNVAAIQYAKGLYKESKNGVFAMVNTETNYPFWITKGLILLADNYVALKDNFQAKHTLKNVIESADIPELVQVAQKKLDDILLSEKPIEPEQKEIESEVEFKQNTETENKDLFVEPTKTEQPK